MRAAARECHRSQRLLRNVLSVWELLSRVGGCVRPPYGQPWRHFIRGFFLLIT